MGLIVHCGGRMTTLEDVSKVKVPEATETYQPVANADLASMIRDRVQDMIGKVKSEQYALARKDQQMFAAFIVDTGEGNRGLGIGFRNSYDMSLSLGLCGGAGFMCCDNLALHGDAFTIFRKHTKNILRDLGETISGALKQTELVYARISKVLDQMKTVEVDLNRGYELIGLAQGYDVLKPQQASVAIKHWTTPVHEEFSERNAHSLYQCFTESAKKGTAGGRIERQIKMQKFAEDYLLAA